MENYKLIGHSGCKLEIEEREDRLLVIKTSKNIEYNDRLKVQASKQKNFRHDFFKVPAVFFEENGDVDLYRFGMEYINGLTLSDHFRKIAISDIEKIVQKFLKMVPNEYEFDSKAKDIFTNKITELEKKIEVSGDKTLSEAFEILKNSNWEHCIAGDCHGDMTLENIIYNGENFYLIDFLDSFYDSWMIDFAKILQDVECKWSYRHDGQIDENLEIRLLIFKQMILDKLLSLENGKQILKTIYTILLINLLRIIPYTKDEYTKNYLLNEIKNVLNKVKE